MKFLFYLVHEYSIPVFQPLVRNLITEKKDYDFRFFLSEKINELVPKDWEDYRKIYSLEEATVFNPDFVLCAENYLDYRLPGLKVQTFHGVGVEKEAHYTIRHFFDIYLTSGPYVTKLFDELAEQYGYFDVIETGWPKFDHILNYPISESGLLTKKDKAKKVILYAPTFSRRMQSAEILANTIAEQIGEDELWLVKFHELMSPKLRALFESLESENLKVVKDSDITPFLHLADIIISDTSSVVYEFLCLEKPVITFRTIGNMNKGIDIQEPGQLRPALDLLLKDPNFQKAERQSMLQQVNPYLDGKISDRVFEALAKLHSKGLSAKKTKPVNLFRKAKIWSGYF